MRLLLTISTFLFVVNGIDLFFRNSSHSLLSHLIYGPLKGKGHQWMEEICDDFGHRLAGSQALESAIDTIVQKLKIDGFQNVHTEPVPGIPHFVRGVDRVTVLQPRRMDLTILAIPNTRPGRVNGEVVVLEDRVQLQHTDVRGKIVVFCQRWSGYSATANYRLMADEVGRKGAIGVLVKSVTPFSLGTPHTGRGGYGVPAASLTIEEAEMLKRWARRGKRITVEMDIRSQNMPNLIMSRNTVFEITGYKEPKEVVLLSAHLDSWDVGQGALDDAAGCAAMYYAMKAIKDLAQRDVRFRPKRTIRGVFWTAEEQGFLGALQYHSDHGRQRNGEKFIFVSETDNGAFKPLDYKAAISFKGTADQMNRMKEIVSIINAFNIPLSTLYSTAQGDVQSFADEGVPSAQYMSDRGWERYFYFHHSNADYSNQIDPEDIDYTAAIFSVLAHIIGNMPSWM